MPPQRFSSAPPAPVAPVPTEAVRPGATTSDAATIIQAEIALAHELLGAPEPIMLLRDEGTLRAVGWVLGRGRAECREAGQLAHIVGIDVVFIGDGVYAVSERTATDGVDGSSQLDARCQMFDSVAAARRYCEEVSGDPAREAARHAALDHAVRRWPPFRGRSAATRAVRVPFQLD